MLLGAWFVVGGGFGLIYAAMALAVGSMVLLWAARWIGASAATPAPADGPGPVPLPSSPVDATRSVAGDEGVPGPGADDDFPIRDYDRRWVSQIIPLLADLDDDELAVVEARERGGRHRAAILAAIDEVRADDDDHDDGHDDPVGLDAPGAGPGFVAAGLAFDDDDEDDDDRFWAPAPPPAEVGTAADAAGTEEGIGDELGDGLDEPLSDDEERLWAQLQPDPSALSFLDEADDDPADRNDRVDAVAVEVEPVRDEGGSPSTAPPSATSTPGADGPVPVGEPSVRLFLGRRRSPVTVRHG